MYSISYLISNDVCCGIYSYYHYYIYIYTNQCVPVGWNDIDCLLMPILPIE